MSKNLHIDNKEYLSSVAAGQAAGYSADHLSRLCRNNNLDCRRVGRVWFIEKNSLNSFLAQAGRLGTKCREADMMSEPSSPAYNRDRSVTGDSLKPTTTSFSVLGVGRVVLTTFSVIAFTVGGYTFARTYDSPLHPVIQSAARDAKIGARYSLNQLAQAFPNTVGRLERATFLARAGGVHTPDNESEINIQQSATSAPQIVSEIVEQTIVQQPVIERIVEKHFTVVESGVTLQQLQQTENELRKEIVRMTAANDDRPVHNFHAIAHTQRIDNLGDVDISNSRITSSTIDATSLTVAGTATFSDAVTFNGTTTFATSPTITDLTLSGDLAVNGGDITTTATTWNFDVANTGTISFRDGPTHSSPSPTKASQETSPSLETSPSPATTSPSVPTRRAISSSLMARISTRLQ